MAIQKSAIMTASGAGIGGGVCTRTKGKGCAPDREVQAIAILGKAVRSERRRKENGGLRCALSTPCGAHIMNPYARVACAGAPRDAGNRCRSTFALLLSPVFLVWNRGISTAWSCSYLPRARERFAKGGCSALLIVSVGTQGSTGANGAGILVDARPVCRHCFTDGTRPSVSQAAAG